jgi:hypothetical protein
VPILAGCARVGNLTLTSRHFNTLPFHSNDTKKVIDTDRKLLLFFSVFVDIEPRLSVPTLSGSANRNPRRSRSLAVSSLRPRHSRHRDEKLFTATLLESTLADTRVSVENRGLTGNITPLESPLTKNRGVGGVMVNKLPTAQMTNRR